MGEAYRQVRFVAIKTNKSRQEPGGEPVPEVPCSWPSETQECVVTEHRYLIVETAHGFGGIGWNKTGIARFQLPTHDAAATERAVLRRVPDAQPGTPTAAVAQVIEAARRYFAGEKIDFSDVGVDLDGQD